MSSSSWCGIIGMLVLVSCARPTNDAAQLSSGSRQSSESARSLQDRYNSIGDALRVLPNVQVTGQTVIFRGNSSFQGDQEMRFVADGTLIGTLQQAEAIIPLNTIKSLRVMDYSDAKGRYGALAPGGVIEIVLID